MLIHCSLVARYNDPSKRKTRDLACPFFVPRDVLNDGSWPHPSRLPLGAGWTGHCCAANEPVTPPVTPDASHLRDFCNLGNAVGCPRLPGNRDWDAVRFSVASSTPHEIVLHFTCERSHAPVAYGKLTFDLNQGSWRDPHRDPRVRRLAESYLHAYRVRQTSTLIESD